MASGGPWTATPARDDASQCKKRRAVTDDALYASPMTGMLLLRTALLATPLLAAIVPLGPANAGQTLTAKERLTDKASDEQRVDNCKVPPEHRGSKPRPDCPVA
ncbi:MAG: hypothetical protein ACREF3_13015, partial [Acetobacteraceae bacterium]